MMKIIFLDIDGVLQPGTQYRFKHDLDQLKNDLIKKNPDYGTMDKYDIGATYYDWDKAAVSLMIKLCETTGAQFVISSDWRLYSTLEQLRLLFALHNMDQYVLDTTVSMKTEIQYRYQEIQSYLDAHNDISHFVIIDDCYVTDFKEHFPSNFVWTGQKFTNENYEQALKILENG